ncbi:MAG: MarR family transcriptional regulator [Candidatus Omnitrophica bacterium]|nr:MarR family transcriptional regulator [Candidatus Omnitrophota bacterium]
MNVDKKINIGKEIAKIHPVILRNVAMNQMTVFSKGKLSIAQVVVLDLLREKGNCKMGDLATGINITMSAVTGIVDKLIARKFVKRERSKEDRRIVYVSLLPKGEEIVKFMNKERRDVANEMFLVLSQDEKKEYLRILNKVFESLRRKNG